MMFRHIHDAKVYTIEAPPGAWVYRSKRFGGSTLYIGDRPFFDFPSEMMVQCAESGRYGLRIVAVAPVVIPDR